MSRIIASWNAGAAGVLVSLTAFALAEQRAVAAYPFTQPTPYYTDGAVVPTAYRLSAAAEADSEETATVAPQPCDTCNSCDSCDNGCRPCCSYQCLRWYVGVGGAWSMRETVHEVGDPATFLEFNDGFAVNVALGRSFDLFRAEFEYSYFNNQVETAGAGIPGVGNFVGDAVGNVSVKAYMVNVYHDFDLGGRLNPYVGGGIGLFQSEINSLLPSFFAQLGAATDGLNTTSDVCFAYQLRAGVNYELTRRTELYTGYRFFDSGDDLTFAASPFGLFHPDSATFHNWEAGLRVKF